MIIGVLKEKKAGETRVAATDDTVRKYIGWGIEVLIEKDAGIHAGYNDDDYIKSGAVPSSREDIFHKADILLSVWGPDQDDYSLLKPEQILIADFRTARQPECISRLSEHGVTILALEKMPRISRAQGMDILSSQNNLAGYKAALLGMDTLNRGIPLMITSAGTIPPAKALVLGAGVAGLQAIATLKRMGAQVWASDVRAAAKEQVESLGGRFLSVDDKADFEGSGGYASEITPEYLLKQKEIVTEQLRQTDILVTTALTGGRDIPVLVKKEMLYHMPNHAVIVDMAGGNVEKNEKRTDILLIQNDNLPALLPNSASRLFSKNILNLLEVYGAKDFKLHLDDEIMSAICVCYNGKIREVLQ